MSAIFKIVLMRYTLVGYDFFSLGYQLPVLADIQRIPVDKDPSALLSNDKMRAHQLVVG